ncbi:MAG TPA: hypothetical protein VNM39_15935, partial [Verrucomicrobiae bacterium]|nr:hypothetical protein [Verrucomicrobiae bacterium]
MAFIRQYTAQGDPRFRYTTMRAGRLYHAKFLSAMRGRRGSAKRRRLQFAAGDHLAYAQDHGAHAARRYSLSAGDPFLRVMRMPAGDPFRLRAPKFLRKLSLKKVIAGVAYAGKGLGGLLKQALPVAGPLVATYFGGPALGALAASALSPHAEHEQPVASGPPGAVAAAYGP